MFWHALNVAGDCSYTQTFNYLIPIPSLWLLLMSLSISRKRAEECFRSYHDDLCSFSIPLVCWLKQESWLGRKCYHSRVNNILQVGSLDQCRKLSDKAGTRNTYISLLVSSYLFSHLRNTDHCLSKEERINPFSNHSNNQGENLWISSSMLCMHSSNLIAW